MLWLLWDAVRGICIWYSGWLLSAMFIVVMNDCRSQFA